MNILDLVTYDCWYRIRKFWTNFLRQCIVRMCMYLPVFTICKCAHGYVFSNYVLCGCTCCVYTTCVCMCKTVRKNASDIHVCCIVHSFICLCICMHIYACIFRVYLFLCTYMLLVHIIIIIMFLLSFRIHWVALQYM